MRHIAAILPAAIVAVFGVRLAAAFAQYDWMGGVLRVSEQYRNISSDKCTTVYKQGSYIKNGDIAYLGQSVCVLQAGGSDDYDIVTNSDIQNNTDLINVIGILPHDSPDGRFIYVDYGGNSIPGVAGISYHQQSGRVLAQRASDYNQPWGLYVYNSIISSLDMQMVSGKIAEYTVKDGSAAEFADTTGIHTLGWLFTNNGKHLMYSRHEGHRTVLRKIDLANNTVEDRVLKVETGEENISLRAATSNGRYLYATTGIGKDSARMIFDTEDCSVECAVRSLEPVLSTVLSDGNQSPTGYAKFSDSDDRLQLMLIDSWYYGIASEVTVAMVPENLVNFAYLALGDSFSSGEGDLGASPLTKSNYYREHTDDDGYAFVDEVRSKVRPTELCHVSTRSYPYKLATGMELGGHWNGESGLWGSVACSNARLGDMGGSDTNSYFGQRGSVADNSPRLRGYNVENLKLSGLNEMVPGRHKQVEFVKKYQPKVVTLMAGGNDVGFSDIIRACVQPGGFGGEWAVTCSYASDDTKKELLALSIAGMREKLHSLYREILQAGRSDAKLYVLGYPELVDDTRAKNNYIIENIATCGANVRLNYQERLMINKATQYLNAVIKSAAREAGAIYIDTASAFGTRKLCGADWPKAVNGIEGGGSSESYHPNEYGHSLLGVRVWEATGGETLLDYECRNGEYVSCPDGQSIPPAVPPYFANSIAHNIRVETGQDITDGFWTRAGKAYITIENYTLNAMMPFLMVIYSDRQVIGEFTANGQGGFSQEIDVPGNLKPGYHTLVIEGYDADGQPLKIWKILEVRSEDPNDWDGDGIPNGDDRCNYIEPLGVDADGDGIDDGCDAEIATRYSAQTPAVNSYTGSTIGQMPEPGVGVRDDGVSVPLSLSQQSVDDWNAVRKEAIAKTGLRQERAAGLSPWAGLLVIICFGAGILLHVRKRRRQ